MTSGHVEQQYSRSDEASAREGMGDIHTPAIRSPRTMAKGSGRPWPTTKHHRQSHLWHQTVQVVWKLVEQSQETVDWEA